MKRTSTFLAILMMLAWGTTSAQRYMTETFSDVDVTTDVTYGVNATVLLVPVLGEAVPEELKMDVYTPAGDTETERPVILYFHTGNFLPTPQNGQPTGTRTDSTAVEVCTRLAKLGYVVASCDYRLGWNPQSTDQSVRVNTLINAAYRGVQDCRTAIRFFRKSAAEGGDPYGIDPERVVVWGQGTGGYIAYAAATIDEYSDIVLPKFTTEVDNGMGGTIPVPMVIEEINGDIYGTSYGVYENDTLCYVNHSGYDSDFNVMVNTGGACGDLSWINAGDVPMISFQVPSDPFAPYTTGTLVVPVLNYNIVEVSGAYDVLAAVAGYGNNDIFELAEGYSAGLPYTDAANANNNDYHGLYPLIRSANPYDSAPWEWWDTNNVNSAAGLATNPDMSDMKANMFIDSIMGYTVPRIACALDLSTSPCYVGIYESEETSVQLFPNPAAERFTVRSGDNIEMFVVYDMMGKVVATRQGVNANSVVVNIENLPVGVYMVEVKTARGTIIEKLNKL
jgi:acetyl esterase/lipase